MSDLNGYADYLSETELTDEDLQDLEALVESAFTDKYKKLYRALIRRLKNAEWNENYFKSQLERSTDRFVALLGDREVLDRDRLRKINELFNLLGLAENAISVAERLLMPPNEVPETLAVLENRLTWAIDAFRGAQKK